MSETIERFTESPTQSPTSTNATNSLAAPGGTISDTRAPATNVESSDLSRAGGHEIDFGNVGPTPHQLSTLIDFFFKVVYPLPSYAFLHPQTTERRCHDQKNHQALSLALCAVTTLYTRTVGNLGNAELATSVAISCERAEAWVQNAEHSVWLHLERPSIPRLQALLLIIHFYMEAGRFQRAFMLIATAARFAAAMGLNHEQQHLDPTSREVRRRILWSLKIIERYFSVGLAEFDMLPFEIIYIDLPQGEELFSTAHPNGEQAVGAEECSAYRLLVRLEAIRWDIMRLTRNISLLERPLSSLAELVDHHCQTLADVQTPPTLFQGMEEGRATTIFRDRWLPRRILAFISWHQAHCDLYRILLPGYPEAAPLQVIENYDPSALLAAEEQCLHHATRIIHILTSLNHNSDRHHLLEFDTAICAYHATRLVLFISRYGKTHNRPSPEFAASRAELCLAALKRFFLSSALVDPIIRELEQRIQLFSRQELRQQKTKNHNHFTWMATGSEHSGQSLAAQRDSAGGVEHSQAAHTRARGKENSLETSDEGSQSKQLSSAAQARQRLAIHSLLRRAEFTGDNLDSEEGNNTQGNDGNTELRRPTENNDMATHNPEPISAVLLNVEQGREDNQANADARDASHFFPRSVSNSPHTSTTISETDRGISSQAQQETTGDAVPDDYHPISDISDVHESTQFAHLPMPHLDHNVEMMENFNDTSPSATSFLDPEIIFFDTGNGSSEYTDQSIFAWWSSQDWGWLLDAEVAPVNRQR
ncbi:hypothetical protein DE146DRAFT_760915 [Phaeosphaeria sp. MPI-PUGE-AT-0046c]|nr:hypothetical protein DE146DRAFT_760915 [Phaeosphaeria sp. MPI-PUGE-AT-0046c]